MSFTPRFNSQPIFARGRGKQATRRPIAHRDHAGAVVQDAGSLQGGLKYNANLDPGFEGFGESEDVHIGGGVVAHFDSTMDIPDPILDGEDGRPGAVADGLYVQMAPLELRAEL